MSSWYWLWMPCWKAPKPLPVESRLRWNCATSKAIGPINLTAIEECNEVEQRYEFLKKQRDDLSTALERTEQVTIEGWVARRPKRKE